MNFTYRGEDYNLIDIVGKDNLIKADSGDKFIILKDGMVILLKHFPDIDCTFGKLEKITLNGCDVVAVQACAFNRSDKALALGRSYGELSQKNVDEFGMKYPISTVENRARNRAIIRHLGIPNVLSEEELASLPDAPPKPVNGEPQEEDKTKRAKLIGITKELCSQLNMTDQERVELYCQVLDIPKNTPIKEVASQLTIEKIEEAIRICKDRINKG